MRDTHSKKTKEISGPSDARNKRRKNRLREREGERILLESPSHLLALTPVELMVIRDKSHLDRTIAGSV